MTEKQFQASIVKLASLLRWHVYHTHDSRHSPAGFPDLILLRGSRMIVAEVKVGKNVTTDAQREWLMWFHFAGAESVLWRPDAAPKREKWTFKRETAAKRGKWVFGDIERRLTTMGTTEIAQEISRVAAEIEERGGNVDSATVAQEIRGLGALLKNMR